MTRKLRAGWCTLISVFLGATCSATAQEDTFAPYEAGAVPQSATDLWKDYDPRKEDLEVKVIKEWNEDGVVTRYVTFKVGRFKGADARVAAYYSFPEGAAKAPAFVWCHGGGQRAERRRGVYFAKQGFATVDVNWLGREMEAGISENTDWGKVDPSQGPRFYKKALRKGWKRNLQPDEHTIDPVASPRNNNWFLLVVAAKRAITFLEEQPEVDADRLGLSGFSMGGTITAMAAMDPRLKAVAPFVGGTAFLHVDFPGLPGTSLHPHVQANLELYGKTVDPSAYWPLVKCPVMFINSTNDFHAAFDRVYQSMELLPHDEWRVSMNVHENHRPGPEQWVMLNKWFNWHLKGVHDRMPATPQSKLEVEGGSASFTVTPDMGEEEAVETEIYYSYDPNSRTRFWIRAEAIPDAEGKSWSAKLTAHENHPLYAFAVCRYPLASAVELQHGGSAESFTLTSMVRSVVPDPADLKPFTSLSGTETVLEDFANGLQDWSARDGRDIVTYKFQSPTLDLANKELSMRIGTGGRNLSLLLMANCQFFGTGKDLGTFTLSKEVEGKGVQDVVIRREDFTGDGKKAFEWSKVARFQVAIFDLETNQRVDLRSEEGRRVLQSIKLVDAE